MTRCKHPVRSEFPVSRHFRFFSYSQVSLSVTYSTITNLSYLRSFSSSQHTGDLNNRSLNTGLLPLPNYFASLGGCNVACTKQLVETIPNICWLDYLNLNQTWIQNKFSTCPFWSILTYTLRIRTSPVFSSCLLYYVLVFHFEQYRLITRPRLIEALLIEILY